MEGRDDMLRDTRVRAVVWVLLGVLVAAVAALILVSAALTGQIRSTQVTYTEKADARDETLAIIQDCTQPGGKCYRRGQRQTAQVLASAQRIIILSSACAADLSASVPVDQRVAQVTACVTKRLSRS